MCTFPHYKEIIVVSYHFEHFWVFPQYHWNVSVSSGLLICWKFWSPRPIWLFLGYLFLSLTSIDVRCVIYCGVYIGIRKTSLNVGTMFKFGKPKLQYFISEIKVILPLNFRSHYKGTLCKIWAHAIIKSSSRIYFQENYS